MNDSTTGVVVAVPTTLLVLAAVGGATAQITQADPSAIKRSLWVTGGVLLAASAASGNIAAVAGTAIAVGAVVYMTKDIWPWKEES